MAEVPVSDREKGVPPPAPRGASVSPAAAGASNSDLAVTTSAVDRMRRAGATIRQMTIVPALPETVAALASTVPTLADIIQMRVAVALIDHSGAMLMQDTDPAGMLALVSDRGGNGPDAFGETAAALIGASQHIVLATVPPGRDDYICLARIAAHDRLVVLVQTAAAARAPWWRAITAAAPSGATIGFCGTDMPVNWARCAGRA